MLTIPVAWAADIQLESVLEGLEVPWEVAFDADGSAYISTRSGTLLWYQNGTTTSVLDLSVGGGEGGMLGVALHPDYAENRMVYVYHTVPSAGNAVTRYIHGDSSLIIHDDIIQNIPYGTYHNGGRISFGPDGMLYISTGDAGDAELSRDVLSLAGKILRLEPDGSIPDDNPIDDSPVFAYGLRNPQGMTWLDNGTMIVTDHGPSGFYGRAHDEINVIVPGGDYGWPHSIGDRVVSDTIPPLLHSGMDTWAPSGIAYIQDSVVPQWNGALLYGALRGEHLGVIYEDGTLEKVLDIGRIRTVVQHPDGSIYVVTSNWDGRGSPAPGDDRLYRITADPPIPLRYVAVAKVLWSMYHQDIIQYEQLQAALLYLSGND